MRKTTLLLAIIFIFSTSFTSFTTAEPKENPRQEKKVHVNRELMEKVVKMSVKDYETLTGKKLNFAEKIAFKIVKKRFEKKLAYQETSGFNIGGFLLGLILGLIGVLIAYLASRDPNFRKWTWIGWGVWVVIVLIVLIA